MAGVLLELCFSSPSLLLLPDWLSQTELEETEEEFNDSVAKCSKPIGAEILLESLSDGASP